MDTVLRRAKQVHFYSVYLTYVLFKRTGSDVYGMHVLTDTCEVCPVIDIGLEC